MRKEPSGQSMPRNGVTLVELMMAVFIGSLLSVALTRLLSSGLKISQKGASHLTNVQNASILLGQIERDLERATGATPGSEADGEMTLDILTVAGPARVVFKVSPDREGVIRVFQQASPASGGGGVGGDGGGYGAGVGGVGEGQAHIFCRGLSTSLGWRRAELDGRVGFFVTVCVKTSASGGEEHRIERLIYCRNHPDSLSKVTGNWRW